MFINKTCFNEYWDVTSQDPSESHMIHQTKVWIHRSDLWVSGRQWMQWRMISVKIIWELIEALMLMWILHCRSNNIWRELMLLSSCFLKPLVEMNHCSSYQTPKSHNVTPVGHLLSSDIKFISVSHVMYCLWWWWETCSTLTSASNAGVKPKTLNVQLLMLSLTISLTVAF